MYFGKKWSYNRIAPSPRYAKTKTQISFAVTAKLISAFVFATQIVQFLYFLNPKFQASSHLLYLYSLICVRPGLKPECWFSHDTAHFLNTRYSFLGFFNCVNKACRICLHEVSLPTLWTDKNLTGSLFKTLVV